MENYQLDNSVSEFILEATNVNKHNRIKNIFNIIYTMNKLTSINIVCDISSIEASVLDIIAEDDIELYNIIDKLDILLKNKLVDYIAKHGIMVDDNILYYQIEDILLGLYSIYTSDIDTANMLIYKFDNNIDSILLISTILSNYSTTTSTELYNIILDVRSDFISNMKKLLESKIDSYTSELSNNITNNILFLINSNKEFANTDIINRYLHDINTNIDTLYNILEKYPNDNNRIVLEISAYIYINNNCESSTGQCDLTDINLEAISYLYNNNESIVNIINSVNNILTNLLKGDKK